MLQVSTRERGAALVIALLAITILAFLGGILLLMSQRETSISRNMLDASAAFNAAEAGLETIFNQFPDFSAVNCTGFPPPSGCSGLTFYSGAGKTLGQTAGVPIDTGKMGPQPCPPGFNLANGVDCPGFLLYSTGMSTSFLVFVNQTVELQTVQVFGPYCEQYNC